MTPHPSYYYSDHNRDHYYSHYPTSTARRCFPHSRRNEVRPYVTSRMSPSPTPFLQKNDSFFYGAHHPVEQSVSNFTNVTSPARRSRISSSSSSSCSPQPPSPPKHPQLVKTMLCDFWRRGEVCRFEPHCWFAHGPMQLRTTDENLSMCNDYEIPVPPNGSTPGHQAMEPSFNQLTPEQQQWMILSQQAHPFLPLPQNIACSRFKDHGKSSSMLEIPAAAHTCEELEQTVRRQLHVSQSSSGVDTLPPSGPPTPTFNSDFFLLAFDDYIREKAISASAAMACTDPSSLQEYSDSYSYAKEECPLHLYGCCPLEGDCFFEHKDKIKE